jgi:uncharacterized protein YrrD
MVTRDGDSEFDFGIGSDVYCSDGRCGRLARVVVDPHTDEVTDLVVEKGFLQKTDRVVPVSAVASTSDGTVDLSVESHTLGTFPEFHETHFSVPAASNPGARYLASDLLYWRAPYGVIPQPTPVPVVDQRLVEGIDTGSEAIGKGTLVLVGDERVGTVVHLLVDREREGITHIVVRRGLIHDYRLVPGDWVASVAEDGIILNHGREALDDLPHYRPPSPDMSDDELAAALERHFYTYAGFGEEAGVWSLAGAVREAQEEREAEDKERSRMRPDAATEDSAAGSSEG